MRCKDDGSDIRFHFRNLGLILEGLKFDIPVVHWCQTQLAIYSKSHFQTILLLGIPTFHLNFAGIFCISLLISFSLYPTHGDEVTVSHKFLKLHFLSLSEESPFYKLLLSLGLVMRQTGLWPGHKNTLLW